MSPSETIEPEARTVDFSKQEFNGAHTHLELSETTPFGPVRPSPPRSYSFLSKKSGAQISSWLSLLKDSSRAPATVPVASNGRDDVGDHANVEVLCISLSFMMFRDQVVGNTWNALFNAKPALNPLNLFQPVTLRVCADRDLGFIPSVTT
jgi:hypothetical protein